MLLYNFQAGEKQCKLAPQNNFAELEWIEEKGYSALTSSGNATKSIKELTFSLSKQTTKVCTKRRQCTFCCPFYMLLYSAFNAWHFFFGQ